MGFGPSGYNGKPFAEMNEEEKHAFASQCESILANLSHYKDDKQLTDALERAVENGLLYHADGKPVAVNEIDNELTEIRNGYRNRHKENLGPDTFLSDLVLVRYDENKPEKQEFSYHPLFAWSETGIVADTTPFTAEKLEQHYKDEAEEIEIQKKIAAERRPVAFNELGPKSYDNVSFDDMEEGKVQEYKAGVADVLGKLANEHDVDSTEFQEILVDATKYGMLIYPDGKEISRQEVEAILQNVRQEPDMNKKSDILDDITVLEYDPDEEELGFLPLSVQATDVRVRSGSGNYLNETQLNKRKEQYEAKIIRQREKAAKAAQEPVVAAPVVEEVAVAAPAEEPAVAAPVVEDKAPVEEVKAPAAEVKAPEKKEEKSLSFGPKKYNNVEFTKMNVKQRQSYESERDSFLRRFSSGIRSPQEFEEMLNESIKYGMIYHADGKPLTWTDVEKLAEKPDTMFELATDLIVVNCDPSGETKNIYNPIVIMNGLVSVDEFHRLTEQELQERQQARAAGTEKGKQAAVLKEQEIARKEKEAAIKNHMRGFDANVASRVELLRKWENSRSSAENDKFRAFFDDLSMVVDDLSANEATMGTEYLTTRIQVAIDRKLVHFSDGSVPKKEDAERIAKTPIFLKDLVFTAYSEGAYDKQPQFYALKLSDDEPPKVQMDCTHPLTPEKIFEMSKTHPVMHTKEELPGLFAQAAQVLNVDNLMNYEQEIRGCGINVTPIEGMEAFRAGPNNDLYVFGRTTPVTSPEELVKEVEGTEPPKEPNAWGIFEFLRKGWHGIFHNVADYVEYENQSKAYEVAKYKLGKQAGFDVGDKDEMIARYEEELVGYRDGLVAKQVQVKPESQAEFDKDLAEALKIVRTCLDEKQPSDFYRSIEAALKENTEFGSIVRKGFANMEHDKYNGFYRKNELLLAKKQFEADKDSPALKRYGKYAAVYTCGCQRAFAGKVFKNKELNFDREVNLFIEKACSAASKLSKANPNMAPDKLQTKIAAEMQKRVDTFKDLAKDAVKDNLDTFEEDLYIAERANASFEEQNVGKVTDVAKAQAATQKIMEGEAEKYAAANPQNNVTQVQNNAPEVQGNVNEAQNNDPQLGNGI